MVSYAHIPLAMATFDVCLYTASGAGIRFQVWMPPDFTPPSPKISSRLFWSRPALRRGGSTHFLAEAAQELPGLS